MRKPWETVKIKILSGYLLVIGIFAITVWLIYSEFFVYVENQTKINSLNNKIIYFNTLLTNLYQIETLERTYSQTGNPKHYASYERLMNIVVNHSRYLIVLGLLSLLIVIIFLVIILKDITKNQRYRHELEKAKAFSDSLLKSKEQFMLSITHDIKTPIASRLCKIAE